LGDEVPARKPKRRWWNVLYVVAPVLVAVAWLARLSGVTDDFTLSWSLRLPTDGACRQMVSTCTLPNEELGRTYLDIDACERAKALVCLVPMGDVSPELIEKLKAGIEADGDLTVVVLPPLSVPTAAYNIERQQFEAGELVDTAGVIYQRSRVHRENLLVVITPVDIYMEAQPTWRFAFGLRELAPQGHPMSIVSSYRLAEGRPSTGLRTLPDRDAEREASRVGKMVNKYIGIDYYGLPPSSDPKSALYAYIRSIDDVDRMSDTLPIDR
jgi:predicted Zn-dependent protease